MLNRTSVRALLASVALVAAAVLVPTTSASATSSRVCAAAWGDSSNTAPDVPVNPGPYVPVGEHYTDCYMKRGITGTGVKALQRSLRICYGQTSVAIDGSFGPATEAALRNVQASLGISADGMYGNQSRDHLRFFSGYHGPIASCLAQNYYPNDVNHGQNY